MAEAGPKITALDVGVGGRFKLGCWTPARAAVEGLPADRDARLITIAPDSDGVGAGVVGAPAEQLYLRVGRQAAVVRAKLAVDGVVVDEFAWRADTAATNSVATADRLYLEISAGGEPAIRSLAGDGVEVASTSAIDTLPRRAIGYESFDAVVLIAGAQTDWLEELSPTDPRVRALVEWAEGGGRLIFSCGAGGGSLLGEGGAFAALVPGEFTGVQSLAITEPIRRFTAPPEDTEAIDLTAGALRLSGLREARGVVEAFAGRTQADSPIVVRTPRGFGEVVFAGIDLDAPALAAWSGREFLLRRLLQLPPAEAGAVALAPPADLANRLIEMLDVRLEGVRTTPFLLVVGLVLAYLALIGPGDYFLVSRVLRRVEATWVTFPLLIVATSAAAYAGAYWLKGAGLRINSVEIVEIDGETGLTRGSLFTHLFAPRAERYDLTLSAKKLDRRPLRARSEASAWLGRPGFGLGAMRSAAGADARSAEYLLSGGSVEGLPVQVWSSRTVFTRYLGSTDRLIDTQLAPDRDGLIEGTITNDTGADLIDCRLLYGSWAWRLGSLADGETLGVDAGKQPIKITTLLKQSQSRGKPKTIEAVAATLSIGGRSNAENAAQSRYLSDLDLTHRLDAGDALLLARVADGPRSELSLGADAPAGVSRRDWVFLRVVLPIAPR